MFDRIALKTDQKLASADDVEPDDSGLSPLGQWVARLTAGALGLGSLKLVWNGIVNRSIEGAGSATFALATKPFKFILLELLWLMFAVLMLWLA